jgi:uncharacterized membrane protein YhfC
MYTYDLAINFHREELSLLSPLRDKSRSWAGILSVSTNVLLTTLLSGRLVWLGRKYRQAFGELSDITVYVSAAAIIIESAIIYTLPQLIGTVLELVDPANSIYAIPSAISCVTSVSNVYFERPRYTKNLMCRALRHSSSPIEC